MEYINNDIFSIDKSRYYIKSDKEENTIFCKKSTINEYNSLNLAQHILSSYPSLKIYNTNYKFIVPKIYGYQNGIIEMEFFKGINLESLLRNRKTHLEAVVYLNYIFSFLINKGFNWTDFAPRNILLGDNAICLIDFEKNLSDSIKNRNEYLQNHVYEEYASFIFESERLFSPDEIFTEKDSNSKEINIDSIKIKRCKYLCELLYNKKIINILEYYMAWKLILKAEIPFTLDGDIIFPRLYLSKILENKNYSNEPYYNYADAIIKINECNELKKKIKLLKRESEVYPIK